jgi:hypothetical protein
MPGRSIVSVRGTNEYAEAAKSGADIADAEYLGSALRTLFSLNIKAINATRSEARLGEGRDSSVGERLPPPVTK